MTSTINEIKERVDKFAIVLTGMPRGVSLYAWRKGMPNTYEKTVTAAEHSAHFPFFKEPQRFHIEMVRVERAAQKFWAGHTH